jgi:hypothetical protein
MALLAEELVEEWLRRQGFFTIRGAKLGVHEMDLLAVRLSAEGVVCRHIEVQASVNPQNYISPLTKTHRQVSGRAASSRVLREEETLLACVEAWVNKKYAARNKQDLLARLIPTGVHVVTWTRELVVHKFKYPRELEFIRSHGVQVRFLSEVVAELNAPTNVLESAAGGDFVNLVGLSTSASDNRPLPEGHAQG